MKVRRTLYSFPHRSGWALEYPDAPLLQSYVQVLHEVLLDVVGLEGEGKLRGGSNSSSFSILCSYNFARSEVILDVIGQEEKTAM